MHRLFAATAVPAETAAQLRLAQTDLPGARWRTEAQFHITLAFYGQVPTEVAHEIADRLEMLRHRPIALAVNGVGWFGRKEPKSLHARMTPSNDLHALAKDCRRIGQQLGLKPDDHPFTPHITLAYCKGITVEQASGWAEQFLMLRSEPFIVDTFHLYESFTAPNRPSQYQKQADYPLLP